MAGVSRELRKIPRLRSKLPKHASLPARYTCRVAFSAMTRRNRRIPSPTALGSKSCANWHANPSAKRRTPKFAEVALVLPKTIFWEVDVEDFMLPGGSLYIPAPKKANLLSVNEFLSET